ncbi:phosphatidate cytidylyltransferase [Asticcacaulis sp. EMRT-3]|uniref:phosphatidate cytidylyltransferase n=1 Tax=Asticcacaulis sp. EMRT-3 TaxID=3040349 RepID=UPI0024AFAA23|nr:phosphatidate cytidylyltransferase [Asticcacaulis sp. EMRT-3]MDI7774844.1 phosphatidate cytidylyltransferase [Asticcacaulis sp. EMRT-3]
MDVMPPQTPIPPDAAEDEGGAKPAPPPASKANWRDLTLRIASAMVLIPAVLWIVVVGGWLFLLMISIGVALLCIEWGLMAAPNASARIACAVAAAALCGLFTGYLHHPALSFIVLIFGSLCAGLYAYRLGVGWVAAAYGVLYIGVPAIILMWLRQTEHGRDWVFFAYGIAWAADIAAYVVGKAVGGPKLWRRYSPNKTWSGFAGGMMAGMLTAGTLSDLTHLFHHDTSASFVGLLVALATMAGDLWESALKRRFGVKDAGDLIPGHGGLMDRVDGLMFAIVAIGGIRLLVFMGTVI